MKKTFTLIALFIVYTILIKTCPIITEWDKFVIIQIQNTLRDVPLIIPALPDCILYSIMLAIPIVGGSIYFLKKREWQKALYICTIPLITFLLNCILKPLVHRVRPPYQLLIFPQSFSYVSSHSLVTIVLWGLVIYYFYKNCTNRIVKYSVITISIFWILFVGFSRVWLGVHYPSDVLGAYFLGFILLTIYSKIRV